MIKNNGTNAEKQHHLLSKDLLYIDDNFEYRKTEKPDINIKKDLILSLVNKGIIKKINIQIQDNKYV